MSIHIRLREERKRLGLTLAQMAERGGINPRSYSHYEKGERMPDAAFLAKVAEPVDGDELSGVDVFYILTGQTIVSKQQPEPLTEDGIEAIVNYKRQQLTADEAEIIENYRRANADGQEAIQKTSAAVGRKSAVVVGGTPAKKRAWPTIVGGEEPKQRPGPTVTGETPKREQKKETGDT